MNGTINRYLYSGSNIVEEYDGSGICQAAYVYEGLDQPIFQRRGNEFYFYRQDDLGNVINTYNYDAFGNILSSTETIPNPFTYTGREYDSESGLYYYRNRYYDSKTGRFLSYDPIKSAKYSYVENNPVNFIDPMGLTTIK